MNTKDIKPFVRRSAWSNSLEFQFVAQIKNETFYAKPIEFVTLEEGEAIQDPALNLSIDQAQFLMDELWSVGLRPTQGKQSEGMVAATERHLSDMRALVCRFAKVELPK